MLLFASTILLSAFLLFLVQPIIAKQILPWFGGTSAVWIMCLVFFQVVLLAGYTYAHVITRRLSTRRQSQLHIALLLASLAVRTVEAGLAIGFTGRFFAVAACLGLIAVLARRGLGRERVQVRLDVVCNAGVVILGEHLALVVENPDDGVEP